MFEYTVLVMLNHKFRFRPHDSNPCFGLASLTLFPNSNILAFVAQIPFMGPILELFMHHVQVIQKYLKLIVKLKLTSRLFERVKNADIGPMT